MLHACTSHQGCAAGFLARYAASFAACTMVTQDYALSRCHIQASQAIHATTHPNTQMPGKSKLPVTIAYIQYCMALYSQLLTAI